MPVSKIIPWKKLTRLPLWLEIALALLCKVAILYCLWRAFFSHPETKKMALPTSRVEQHLLSTAAALPKKSVSIIPVSPTSPSNP